MGLSEWEAVIVKGVDAEGLTMALSIFHAEEEEMKEAMRRVVGRVVVERYILALVWLLFLEATLIEQQTMERMAWIPNCHRDTCLLQRSEGVSILLYTSFKLASAQIGTSPQILNASVYSPCLQAQLMTCGPCCVDWSLVHIISL